jgi:hypothetical protein
MKTLSCPQQKCIITVIYNNKNKGVLMVWKYCLYYRQLDSKHDDETMERRIGRSMDAQR